MNSMSSEVEKRSEEFIKGYKDYVSKHRPDFDDYGCNFFTGCILFCTKECSERQNKWNKEHDSEFYDGYKLARIQANHLPKRLRLFSKDDNGNIIAFEEFKDENKDLRPNIRYRIKMVGDGNRGFRWEMVIPIEASD